MERLSKQLLLGTGVVAASAAVLGTAVSAASSRLVRMAADRECPRTLQSYMDKVSGSTKNAVAQQLAAAKEQLEGTESREVRIRSHDGLLLVGHWRQAKKPRRVLIAMHGWRSSWSRDFGPIQDFWYENGCSVLYAEQRGQGKSEGSVMGFGLLERYDCLGWVRWAAQQAPGLPVYLVGISMGATSVLMAGELELPACVHGILADCGFTSVHDIWKHVAKKNLRLSYALFGVGAEANYSRRLHIPTKDLSTVSALRRCRIPVLFAHGTADSFVPVEMTYENYRACAAPKRLLIVPGAEHGMSCLVEPHRYKKAMLDFFASFDG